MNFAVIDSKNPPFKTFSARRGTAQRRHPSAAPGHDCHPVLRRCRSSRDSPGTCGPRPPPPRRTPSGAGAAAWCHCPRWPCLHCTRRGGGEASASGHAPASTAGPGHSELPDPLTRDPAPAQREEPPHCRGCRDLLKPLCRLCQISLLLPAVQEGALHLPCSHWGGD